MVNEISNRFIVSSTASAKQSSANKQEYADSTKNISSKSADSEIKADKAQAPATVDSGKIEKAVDDLNQHVSAVGRDLRFSVDRESGYTIIKVMDRETEQVVRQIPPEEAIALAKFLHQTNDLSSTGLFEEA